MKRIVLFVIEEDYGTDCGNGIMGIYSTLESAKEIINTLDKKNIDALRFKYQKQRYSSPYSISDFILDSKINKS